ncbi:MAG: 50S ribosomal protein L19 [Candidatus Giovannonibacteria bacterium GW2011_GWC2_44_9]|uniref:50S ribosomal protein L19 n=3 Tax=Candidatus Giovannoniibacteriota TaxID=1752738 RepID=A0A0G1L2B9_9BACT|nr:MAG: 50S ribosomal protein L19 [Candidatus Giovannonibacteria bacterium GW2011_GWB1_44_23]KKT62757.1 MAG: 50S ribosomal protein L19 [Candidatus Giovannonibacteria bacterium GW2011_GWA1_44_29]KKT83781.1 MAG: 50S ribosomal protein L19 [Candidatus Giovannonibacteria bacterium GW2011_GWC2_44_9]KKT91031.1 MAG: 50S ribosomal protein L19 [Parcubacteria group bacterium GW2011_GWC1_45_13]
MPSLNLIHSPVDIEARKKLDFRAGDTIRVTQKVKEGEKTRLQAFEGMVLAIKHGQEPGATFTMRKVIDGVGVERIFPLYSPEIDKIEIKSTTKFKRAKLYYVRDRAAREIRKKMKQTRFDPRLDVARQTTQPPKAEASSQ